jgi:hypothetical protein
MAQTRATSKALRVPLGFIVVLAGYEATPEEEMPTIVSGPSPEGTKDASGAPLTTYSETSPETVPSRSEPPAKVGSSSPSSRSVSVEAPVGEGGIALSSGAEPCAKFVTSTGDTWGACERCGLAIEAHR